MESTYFKVLTLFKTKNIMSTSILFLDVLNTCLFSISRGKSEKKPKQKVPKALNESAKSTDEQMAVEEVEESEEEDNEEELEEAVDEKLESLNLKPAESEDPFTLSYSAQPVKNDAETVVVQSEPPKNIFMPHPRRSSYLQFHKGVLYLYGGKYEDENEKEFTFSDMYALNLKKLDEWKTLFEDRAIHAEIQKSKASKFLSPWKIILKYSDLIKMVF
jgi:hypothetical protein